MTTTATTPAGGTDTSAPAPLLSVRDLTMTFPGKRTATGRRGAPVRAVDGVSFDLAAGQTLGLVGESGCGKSTTGRMLVRLLEPTSGQIAFDGRQIGRLSQRALRPLRRDIQMVFQDPHSSLNPRQTVARIIADPLLVQGRSAADARRRAAELMELVGLIPEHIDRYPHEFSGGQAQRIGIARSLATSPRLIVADEPVSALDVSVQAQIVNLMERLRAELGLAYVFIAHDLSVVKRVSDRVAVMYLGRIVEIGDKKSLYESPQHPYTRALLSAVPLPDPEAERRRERIVLLGDPPSPAAPPPGCAFHPGGAPGRKASPGPRRRHRRPGRRGPRSRRKNSSSSAITFSRIPPGVLWVTPGRAGGWCGRPASVRARESRRVCEGCTLSSAAPAPTGPAGSAPECSPASPRPASRTSRRPDAAVAGGERGRGRRPPPRAAHPAPAHPSASAT